MYPLRSFRKKKLHEESIPWIRRPPRLIHDLSHQMTTRLLLKNALFIFKCVSFRFGGGSQYWPKRLLGLSVYFELNANLHSYFPDTPTQLPVISKEAARKPAPWAWAACALCSPASQPRKWLRRDHALVYRSAREFWGSLKKCRTPQTRGRCHQGGGTLPKRKCLVSFHQK